MKKLIALIVVLILSGAVIPARAGKPAPQPYPQPGAEAQAGANPYPEPGPGLPAPDFDANAEDFCTDPLDVCSWGFFGKWYASSGPRPLMTFEYGTLCLNWIGHGVNYCTEIGFESYNPNTQTLVYSANPTARMCNKWWGVIYLFWLGEWAEIREPNEYYIACDFLPLGLKPQFPSLLNEVLP